MKMHLTLYRNEVVPVYTTDKGNKVVLARELYNFLNLDERFNGWISRKIKTHNFVENVDYTTFTEKTAKGRPTKEYIFLQDPAKKIAMGTNNEQGDLVKDYFIRIEKEAKANLATVDFAIHTQRPVQIQNSKDINRHLWETKDTQAIGEYHRELTKTVCGKTPSQLKKDAKAAGLPSKCRTSGREVLRHTQPESACTLSLCDQLSKAGAKMEDLKPIIRTAPGFFAEVLKLGFIPTQLTA